MTDNTMSPIPRSRHRPAAGSLSWARVALAVSLGLGVVIRLRQYVAGRSLWADEAALGLNIINRTAPELLRPLDYSQGAPVGYLLLTRLAVVLAGPGELALRAVALVSGLLALLLFAVLARKVLDEWPAALAVAIMAFAPLLIAYSNELKQYQGDVLATVVALLLFLRLRTPLTPAIALAAAALGTALTWLSHPSIFVLAAVGLTALVEAVRRRDRRSAWLLVGMGGAWIASVVVIAAASIDNLMTNASLLDFWNSGFVPAPLPLLEFARWLWVKANDLTTFMLQLSAVGLVAAAAGIARWGRRDRGMLAALLLPIGFALLASALRRYPFSDRLLLFTTPLVALLVAEGTSAIIERLRPLGRLATGAVVVVLLAPSLLQAADLLRAPQYKEELGPVVAHVAAGWQEGDRLAVYYSSGVAFEYYRRRHAFPDESIILVEGSRQSWTPYFRTLDRIVADGGRVWFIFSHVYTEGGGSEEAVMINYLYERGYAPVDSFFQPGASGYLFDFSN